MRRSPLLVPVAGLAALGLAALGLAACSSGAPARPATTQPGAPAAVVPPGVLAAASRPPRACQWAPARPGVFQFTGAPQAANPSVDGGVVVVPWSAVEPRPGSVDTSVIDRAAAAWKAAGKRWALRVVTFDPGAAATPPWLFAAGAPWVTDAAGARAPVYWAPAYQQALGALVRALAARYDGDQTLAWVQAGVGVYGETKVDRLASASDLAAWAAAGYTDARWESTVAAITAMYTSDFPRTPVTVAVDATFVGRSPGFNANRMVADLDGLGAWVQDDGLRATTHYTSGAWSAGCLIEEQYQPSDRVGESLASELSAARRVGADVVLLYPQDLARSPGAVAAFRAGAPR
jgi:hypothetical protein